MKQVNINDRWLESRQRRLSRTDFIPLTISQILTNCLEIPLLTVEPRAGSSSRAARDAVHTKEVAAANFLHPGRSPIEGTIRTWVDLVAEPAIVLRREVSNGVRELSDIAALVSRKEGKKFFDALRNAIAAFREFEQDLKAKNQQSADKADRGAEQNLSVMLENERRVTDTPIIPSPTFASSRCSSGWRTLA